MYRSIARRSNKIALSFVAFAVLAGAIFAVWRGANPASAQDLARPAADSKIANMAADAVADEYIIVFREEALAGYSGRVPGYPKARKMAGKARLDVKDPNATRYVSYLQRRQIDHEAKISQKLGRRLEVSKRMQHALNAIVARLSPQEVQAVAELNDVYIVEPVVHVPMDTDVGPALIGAEPLWNGTVSGSSVPVQGEGMVIGIIDSGINFGSPSFAAVDPVDGYQHVNPLGANNHLGTCAPNGVDAGRCNAKLIGGYDFVCAAPGNQCNLANVREEPGFGDTNGHGTHTASTVAGNRRDLSILNTTRRISGVAPRANIIAYDVCYTNTSTGQGLCPNASSAAAVNQAIADGVVDALNFSIGGGTSPWADAVSLAFLNATDAGIYVATSAGNDGPGANTMGHLEPWTASTAAAQHGRSTFSIVTSITGPGSVPAALTNLPINVGTGGVGHPAAVNAALIASPGFTTTNDACAPLPAGTFQGGIALVLRGTCGFIDKVNNAKNAGAIAVLIANNTGGTVGLIPNVTGATIPAYGVSQNQGNDLRTFAVANPSVTATIPFEGSPIANNPDQLAAFSSRGPAGNFDLIKPNVTAPGVSVLAAYAGTAITGSEQLTASISGTSMASPHNAGAALLLRQMRPTWSVSEVKSALEMTATQAVTMQNGTTPASPHDMGSGRIRVNYAANAGLVLNEVKTNFQAANPSVGGNISSLNLASMAKRGCVGECQFVRTFRSTLSTSQTWDANLSGLAGTVSPSTFTVAPGGTVTLTVTINTSTVTPNGAFNFGRLELTPVSVPSGIAVDSTLRLPIGVTVPPPAIALIPPVQDVSLVEGHPGSASFAIRNNGGYQLEWSIDQTGSGAVDVASNLSRGTSNNGFFSGAYSDNPAPNPAARYGSDDFNVQIPTTVTSLYAEGFTVSGQPLASVAQNITWSIFPDLNGVPAGNPHSNPAAAVWTYTAAPNSAGVTVTGSNIRLDLPAAAQSITLQPGRYWLVVAPRTTFANRWAWFASNAGTGTFVTVASPPGTWVTAAAPFTGLIMQVNGTAPCGASWIGSTNPVSGVVLGNGGTQQVQTALSAVGLTPGNYTGAVCVASNDPSKPKAAEVLRLTVTPNTAPTIDSLVVTRQQGTGASVSQIATVGDVDTGGGSVAVTVDGGASATVSGVTVSNIVVNADGTVNASVAAACGASNASFTLRATDPGGLFAEATLNVTVNNETTPPVIGPAPNVVAILPNGPATSMPVTFSLPSATDNCSTPTVTANPPSGSVFPLGSTTVTVTAADSVGNTSTTSFTVSVQYAFTGFTGRALSNSATNWASAGNTIPIGFSLGGNKGLNIFASGSPSSRQVSCSNGSPIGLAAPAALSPPLAYQNGQYIMYWRTNAAWAGTCRAFSVTLNDGTTRNLNFSFYNY